MSLRAQARIMALYSERQESPVAFRARRERPRALEDWMEEWYYAGAVTRFGGPRVSYEVGAKGLHLRLHALRSMTDEQYIEMRKRRCFRPEDLGEEEFKGVLLSARSFQIYMTRRELKCLELRLACVVRSLPNRSGFAADQDHFELRSWKERWYVNQRFASYVSLEKRLRLYKEMRSIERRHDERRREERETQRRANEYPELLRRIRELEERRFA